MSEQLLDDARLGEYLSSQIADFDGLREVKKFSDGQSNPTFLLNADSGRYVLRSKPPGKLLPSAHAVEREYRVMKALEPTPVPVPKMLHLCEDTGITGAVFFVMQHVEGDIHWNAALPDHTNQQRANIYDSMNCTLADLHDVDYEQLGLGDYGKPGNYFERQLNRWTAQYRASETETIDAMDRLIHWLHDALPPDDGQACLVHGDYRLDNMIFESGGSKVAALLDWELSTLGHPCADLAYQCMQLRLPSDAMIPGLAGADRASLGIPSEAAYVQGYCDRRGIDSIENWSFYLAFSFFRLAAILQGVYKRGIDGNASSEKARRVGALAAPLAKMGYAIVQTER